MHCNAEEDLRGEMKWIFKMGNTFGYNHKIIQQLVNRRKSKMIGNKENKNCKFIGSVQLYTNYM